MAANNELKTQVQDSVQRIRQLRDEIRIDLHLASLDAKDRWRTLEPKLEDAERFGREISEASKSALQEISRSYEEFRYALRHHPS